MQVAAWHRGETARVYLAGLPAHLTGEVHVSGPVMVGGELRDRHGEMGPEGYELLTELLSMVNVSTVTLEYGGVGPEFAGRSDPTVLERQLRRLREVLINGQASTTVFVEGVGHGSHQA